MGGVDVDLVDIMGMPDAALREFLRITERKAKAPMNSCLDSSKLKKDFGLMLPDFKTSLLKMKKQMEALP